MTSADTNLFLYATNSASPFHAAARMYFDNLIQSSEPFAVSLRTNPKWTEVDDVPAVSQELWNHCRKENFAFRRIIDAWLALTLRFHGVVEFATANTRDFSDFGFSRVWNPLSSPSA